MSYHYINLVLSILKSKPFCSISYTYGVSSVYTVYIHFMTYPASSCLIKLTSSDSSTISNEKYLSYIHTYINNQFKTSKAHNTIQL